MTCKEVREYMLDAAQGSPVAELDDHLKSCVSCARELESMRQTIALLDEWEAPEPSPYFDSRLRTRIREAAVEPRSWLEWMRKPAIAFALAVLMLASITIFRNAPDHQMAANPKPNLASLVQRGTAVSDLQELEHNGDMYANFDMLDDLGGETANP